MTGLEDVPVDGILGLAFQTLAADGVMPPLVNAIQQNALDEPIFSVWLDTEGFNQNTTGGGVFTFGGLDTENCGPVIDYVPLLENAYWKFQIDSVSLGDKYTRNQPSVAISDTGTSLIIGPPMTVIYIANSIGAVFNQSVGGFTIACDAVYDPVTLTINGNPYHLTSKVLTMNVGFGNNQCLFAMIPNLAAVLVNMEFDWLLGDPFIRQYCQVYDMGQRRLGLAASNSGGASGEGSSGGSVLLIVGMIALLIAIVVVVAGGAFAYFGVYKKRQNGM
jgi:hypothetical protein